MQKNLLTTDPAHCTVEEAIEDTGAIAVLRKPIPEEVQSTMEALIKAGITVAEFTTDDPNADTYFERYAKDKRVFVGAGTVRSASSARSAASAGAKFLVSHAFSPKVAAEVNVVARQYGIPYFIGCDTPGEMEQATELTRTSMVKLFPASKHGPAGIKHLFGPRPDLRLIVAGFDTLEQGLAYIYNGAAAIAFNPGQFAEISRPLVPELIVSQGRWLLEEIKLKKALSKS